MPIGCVNAARFKTGSFATVAGDVTAGEFQLPKIFQVAGNALAAAKNKKALPVLAVETGAVLAQSWA